MPETDQRDPHAPGQPAAVIPAMTTPRRAAGAPQPAARTLGARELLGPGGLLRIDLDGEIYTLRLTRNHRLILTK